jgi:hypothetical protein
MKNKWLIYYLIISFIVIIAYFSQFGFSLKEVKISYLHIFLFLLISIGTTLIFVLTSKKEDKKREEIISKLTDFDENNLVGKSLTIIIVFRDYYHRKIEEYVTTGIISEISENNKITILRDDNSLFVIPFNICDFVLLQKSEIPKNAIKCKSEFYTKWIINDVDSDYIKNCKKQGYVEPKQE